MTSAKNKSHIIGTCGHPAKTKRQQCDECRRANARAAWTRYYDRYRRVNWLAEIEKYEAVRESTC